ALIVNRLFMQEFLAAETPCCALGMVEERQKPYPIGLLVCMARSLQELFGEAIRGAPECRLRGTTAAPWLRVATGTRNPPRGHTSCPDLRGRQYGSRYPPRTSP